MDQAEDELQQLKDLLIRESQERHVSLKEAARELQKLHIPRDKLDRAVAELEDEMAVNVLVTPSIVDTSNWLKWYLGPVEDGHWAAYRELWLASGKPGLDELDRSTTELTKLLANPNSRQRRKGLVMGNVQSGKTGNFAGLIAKATDAGYRLVIVASGLHNNLRNQTQDRLVHDVLRPGWRVLTKPDEDVPPIAYPQHDITATTPTAAVVKKNKPRLNYLIDALKALPVEARRKIPVLIIDDEADQATPNTPTARAAISAINGCMRELWRWVEVGTYVAYTATPFANVLMDPDDTDELFPSDFISILTPGETYFGAERVFGVAEADEDGEWGVSDGLDMVRHVSDIEAQALRPPSNLAERESFVPPIVPSMEEALRWFVVATAIRLLRKQEEHSSMLIHTTHYIDPHVAMQTKLQTWVTNELEHRPLQKYREVWLKELGAVVPETPRFQPEWTEIEAMVPGVLNRLKVIVDNGKSADRLSYSNDQPEIVIAIGGGTLARGLTLEGLVVSFFTRTTNTYDTLMQMGRWFGYRDGYEDLPRLWVSTGLDKDYAFLARVERDLRAEIQALADSEFTPAQAGVRVRQHPGRLEITSMNRMRKARTVQVSLSGVGRQTFLLDGSDPSTQERNLQAVNDLVGNRLDPDGYGRLFARGVTSDRVVTFLRGFYSHKDQRVLQSDEQQQVMADWIRSFAGGSSWSVLVTDNTAPDAQQRLGSMMIGGQKVNMVNRAPLVGSTPDRLDFKAVMSPSDWIADIRDELEAGELPSTPAQRLRARRVVAEGRGLIVIYAISPWSAPARVTASEKPSRMEMPVEHPMLAYAIVFPFVKDVDKSQGTFVSVRSTPVVERDDDEAELEEIASLEDLLEEGP